MLTIRDRELEALLRAISPELRDDQIEAIMRLFREERSRVEAATAAPGELR